MVRAILEGRKTQTRRIVKPPPIEHNGVIEFGDAIAGSMDALTNWMVANKCPYGKLGDRLWVREKFAEMKWPPTGPRFVYAADGECDFTPWRPSIHMPRCASRVTLEVVSVRVERLQECSEADAKAEGCSPLGDDTSQAYRLGYMHMWGQINGPGSWEANPWVWVVEFKRIEP